MTNDDDLPTLTPEQQAEQIRITEEILEEIMEREARELYAWRPGYGRPPLHEVFVKKPFRELLLTLDERKARDIADRLNNGRLQLNADGRIPLEAGLVDFPMDLTVWCEDCRTEVTREYTVNERMTKTERLAIARTAATAEGWRCHPLYGDYCPACRARREAEGR